MSKLTPIGMLGTAANALDAIIPGNQPLLSAIGDPVGSAAGALAAIIPGPNPILENLGDFLDNPFQATAGALLGAGTSALAANGASFLSGPIIQSAAGALANLIPGPNPILESIAGQVASGAATNVTDDGVVSSTGTTGMGLDCYQQCALGEDVQVSQCEKLNQEYVDRMMTMGCPGTVCTTPAVKTHCYKRGYQTKYVYPRVPVPQTKPTCRCT